MTREWFLAIALVFGASPVRAEIDLHQHGSLLIRNVRVIDGRGTPPSAPQAIKIVDGVIVMMAPSIPDDGTPVVEGGGATVVPGLIDAHVHLRSVPGSVYRKDDPLTYRRLFAAQMRAYVASGVTAVLDAATPRALVQTLKDYFAAGGVGPAVSYLAPMLTPNGGYFGTDELKDDTYADIWPPIDAIADVGKTLEAADGLGQVGVKVMVEQGFGPFDVWPVFDEAMSTEIRQAAGQRRLPIFVHSMSELEHGLALALQPRGFMHAGYAKEAPSAAMLSRIAASSAVVVSTLAIFDMALIEWNRPRLDEPWMTKVVPELELVTARDPRTWDLARDKMTAISTPKWLPNFLARALIGAFFNESVVQGQLASSRSAIKAMHAAGIPIVMGSDSGCWPALPYMFHGVSSIREVELLHRAGLSPLEALKAATSTPARMLGIDGVAGTLEVGKRGDLVVIDGELLKDLSLLRTPRLVVRRGVAKSPAEWLGAASPL